MDWIITWLLEKVLYPFILLFEKKKYVIPVDTTREHIIRQNTLINVITSSADLICAVIIIMGWQQQVVTYVGMMTISMYIFAEHFKIYCEQYKKLKGKTYICEIRKRENKNLWWYTPNLRNVCVSGLFFIIFVFMAIFEITNYYQLVSSCAYKIFILLILLYMMYIKLKYYFLDTFDIKEVVFIKNNEL